MPVAINGTSGVITGVATGGLPDGIVDTDMLAANAVATAKIADDAITDAKQNLSGIAKAWVRFDGTGTVSITDSFNVSSITDNGTGNYFINFSNNLSNANYCVVTGAGGGTGSLSDGSNVGDLATDKYRQEFGNGGSYHDFARCFSIVMGG